MTVSLALRAHGSIPAATRARIQRVARDQGYVPDPMVAKLMGHLATRRSKRHHANLCALTPAAPYLRPQGFLDRMLRSLASRAESLGYAFSVVNMDAYSSPARLRRFLRSRGIEGIVLTPMESPRDLRGALAWEEFSAVSVTPSVVQPQFHTVSPNHFDNMLKTCRALNAAGYRRIGLALPQDRDELVRHRWSGAFAWHNLFDAEMPLPPLLDPTSRVTIEPLKLDGWLREHSPEVVITDRAESAVADALKRNFGPGKRPLLVAMNWPNPFAGAGIDQRVEDIGAMAIERLAAMIQHGEKGPARTPSTTMVEGEWVMAGAG